VLTNASLSLIVVAVLTGALILVIDRMSFARPEKKQVELMRRLSSAS
jgi:hypothetical protein